MKSSKFVMIYFVRKFCDNAYDKANGVKKLLVDSACKYDVPLSDKNNANHDVRIFRFQLPEENMILGHGCGNHCSLHSKVGEEYLTRSFTPTSPSTTKGYVEFMIKIYFKNVHPKFPAGGKFTQYLNSLNIGDIVQISGPEGNVTYKGRGEFIVKTKKGLPLALNIKRLGLIAGGVGFTPALQILRTIAADPEDKTECSLIYASKEQKDILRTEELDELTEKLCGRLKIWHTLEKAEPDWCCGAGYVNKQMLLDHLAPPSKDSLCLISGPWPMLTEIKKLLVQIGYKKEMYSLYF